LMVRYLSRTNTTICSTGRKCYRFSIIAVAVEITQNQNCPTKMGFVNLYVFSQYSYFVFGFCSDNVYEQRLIIVVS
jgi:hypothetical protein